MKGFQQLSLSFLLVSIALWLTRCTALAPHSSVISSESLTNTALPVEKAAKPERVALPPICKQSEPSPYMGANGKVFVGITQVFDPAVAAPQCSGIGQISPSPSGDYFLVVMDCPEGLNDAFLFNADGSQATKITGPYDYVDYFNYRWSKDGKSLSYTRVNACCQAKPPADAPPAGKVRLDLTTGEKTLFH